MQIMLRFFSRLFSLFLHVRWWLGQPGFWTIIHCQVLTLVAQLDVTEAIFYHSWKYQMAFYLIDWWVMSGPNEQKNNFHFDQAKSKICLAIWMKIGKMRKYGQEKRIECSQASNLAIIISSIFLKFFQFSSFHQVSENSIELPRMCIKYPNHRNKWILFFENSWNFSALIELSRIHMVSQHIALYLSEIYLIPRKVSKTYDSKKKTQYIHLKKETTIGNWVWDFAETFWKMDELSKGP